MRSSESEPWQSGVWAAHLKRRSPSCGNLMSCIRQRARGQPTGRPVKRWGLRLGTRCGCSWSNAKPAACAINRTLMRDYQVPPDVQNQMGAFPVDGVANRIVNDWFVVPQNDGVRPCLLQAPSQVETGIDKPRSVTEAWMEKRNPGLQQARPSPSITRRQPGALAATRDTPAPRPPRPPSY